MPPTATTPSRRNRWARWRARALWWLHIAVEGGVGGLMLANPALMFPGAGAAVHKLARPFGLAALCLAALGWLTLRWPHSAAVRIAATVLSGYHGGIALLQIVQPMAGLPIWLAPLFHGLLALGFGRAARRAQV